MEYYQDELAKFTDEDEMLKLDSKVEKSAATLIPFKNYSEVFEHYAMTDKSAISAQQLRLKYNHICLYDEEAKEIRRVVNVEWSKRRRPIQAQHSLVTQKNCNTY